MAVASPKATPCNQPESRDLRYLKVVYSEPCGPNLLRPEYIYKTHRELIMEITPCFVSASSLNGNFDRTLEIRITD